jgi:hypothetical protein
MFGGKHWTVYRMAQCWYALGILGEVVSDDVRQCSGMYFPNHIAGSDNVTASGGTQGVAHFLTFFYQNYLERL